MPSRPGSRRQGEAVTDLASLAVEAVQRGDLLPAGGAAERALGQERQVRVAVPHEGAFAGEPFEAAVATRAVSVSFGNGV